MGSGDAAVPGVLLPHSEQGWELPWWAEGLGAACLRPVLAPGLSVPAVSITGAWVSRAEGPLQKNLPFPSSLLSHVGHRWGGNVF